MINPGVPDRILRTAQQPLLLALFPDNGAPFYTVQVSPAFEAIWSGRNIEDVSSTEYSNYDSDIGPHYYRQAVIGGTDQQYHMEAYNIYGESMVHFMVWRSYAIRFRIDTNDPVWAGLFGNPAVQSVTQDSFNKIQWNSAGTWLPFNRTVNITNGWDKPLSFQVKTQGWNIPVTSSPTLTVAAGQTASVPMPPGNTGGLNYWIEVVGWGTPGVGVKSAVIPLPPAGTTLSYKFIPGFPASIVPG